MLYRTIDQILVAAGGEKRIANKSLTTRKPIAYDAVRRWRKNGIRDVHWPLLMALDPDLTERELLHANQALAAEMDREACA